MSDIKFNHHIHNIRIVIARTIATKQQIAATSFILGVCRLRIDIPLDCFVTRGA